MIADLQHLTLPDTRLVIENGDLVRYSLTDDMILRLPLAAIQSSRLTHGLNTFSIVTMVSGLAIGIIAWSISKYYFLSVLLYLLGVVAIAFGTITLLQYKIVIVLRHAEHEIEVTDSVDVAAGFVTSLNYYLQSNGAARESA